jgi:prepilin-type processing-associated H-X9-DG protein
MAYDLCALGNIFIPSQQGALANVANKGYPARWNPYYHNLASNWLFIDGSVRAYSCKVLFDSMWRPKL